MNTRKKMWSEHSHDEVEFELFKIGLNGSETAGELLDRAFSANRSELLRSDIDLQSFSLERYIGVLMGIQVLISLTSEEE